MRVISIAYMALIPWKSRAVQAGDDAKEAKWFSIHDTKHELILQSEDMEVCLQYSYTSKGYHQQSEHGLAFDHLKILTMALQRLKQTTS